ncbi:hypothetical protein OAO18_05665 [Francisellaceae bacterium]|nr:hypothetical protein [Francisellaceae bacterium]
MKKIKLVTVCMFGIITLFSNGYASVSIKGTTNDISHTSDPKTFKLNFTAGKEFEHADRLTDTNGYFDGSTIITVSKANENQLYYRTGKPQANGEISWYQNGGYPYHTGLTPKVAVFNGKIIIETHAGEGDGNLYYSLGKLSDNKQTIQFSGTKQYDTGRNESIVTNGDELIEVHNGSNGRDLYYRTGHLSDDGKEIIWNQNSAIKYGDGDHPSITVVNNTLVEIHHAGASGDDPGNLYYTTADILEDGSLNWHNNNSKFAQGNSGASITTFQKDKIVIAYNYTENEGSSIVDRVSYTSGRLSENKEIEWFKDGTGKIFSGSSAGGLDIDDLSIMSSESKVHLFNTSHNSGYCRTGSPI